MTGRSRRARFDPGTLSFLTALAAGSFVFLLLAFGWLADHGAFMPGDTILEDALEDSPQAALLFIPLILGGLLATGVAFWLGIVGMLRRGSNRLLAFLGTAISAFILVVAYLDWVLPALYCC